MAKFELQQRLVVAENIIKIDIPLLIRNAHFVNIMNHIIELPLAICHIVEKFESNFTLHDAKTIRRHRNAKS